MQHCAVTFHAAFLQFARTSKFLLVSAGATVRHSTFLALSIYTSFFCCWNDHLKTGVFVHHWLLWNLAEIVVEYLVPHLPFDSPVCVQNVGINVN